MKKINLTAMVAVLFLALQAQVPQQFNYQAVARDASGNTLCAQSVTVRFTIHDNTADGVVVYQEIHHTSTNKFGLFNTPVGSGEKTKNSGDFSSINWGSGGKYLQVETDMNGGYNFTDMGVSQLLSVPYALHAGNADGGGEKYLFQGPTGPTGPTGAKGATGPTGAQGIKGATGATGAQGVKGNTGATGARGVQGPAGTNGSNGSNGATGPTGAQGIQGPAGSNGTNGINGLNGATGPTGPAGSNGTNGATGATGTFQNGSTPGEMLYWDGNNWVAVAPGTTGQNLTFCNGVPTWGPCPAVIPTLSTTALSSITQTSAASGGNITSDGGATVTARGVCYSFFPNPTTANSPTSDGTGTGTFTSSMTGLYVGTVYHVRAYATNSVGTAYGNDITFNTLPTSPPTVTTASLSSIGANTAVCGGNVTSDGGLTVTARGVCWSTSPGPLATGSHTFDGSGTGSFTSNMFGLTALATYYVRAYATNSAGTSYGNEISFTTVIAVGVSYQGGIIGYIFQPGDPGYVPGQIHGLIAGSDLSGTATWGCTNTLIGGTSTALGSGQANTTLIVNSGCATGANIAATLCDNYSVLGYSDWYLPSKDELNLLYLNIGNGASGANHNIGNFAQNYWIYFSSSEIDNTTAWQQEFTTGQQIGGLNNAQKYFQNFVRPVRTF